MNEDKQIILNNDATLANEKNNNAHFDESDVKYNYNITNHIKIITSDEKKFRISVETAKKFGLIQDWLDFNPDINEELQCSCDSEEIKWLLFLEKYRPRVDVEDYLRSNIKKLRDNCIFSEHNDANYLINLSCFFQSINKNQILKIKYCSGMIHSCHPIECIFINDIKIYSPGKKPDIIDKCAKYFNLTRGTFIYSAFKNIENKKFLSYLLYDVMSKNYAYIAPNLCIDTKVYELILKWLDFFANSEEIIDFQNFIK